MIPLEPVCEAAVIAQYAHTLTEAQWLEVVEVAREIGQIASDHADVLIELISEAYSGVDLREWVAGHCGGVEV